MKRFCFLREDCLSLFDVTVLTDVLQDILPIDVLLRKLLFFFIAFELTLDVVRRQGDFDFD